MNEKDRIEVDRSTQVNSRKKRKKWYNVLKTKTRFIKVPENVDEETLSAQVNEEIEKKHRISGSGLLKGAVATGMLFGGAAMQNMTAYANENDSTSENITEDDHDDTSSSDATDSDTSSSESDASDSEGSSDASSDDSDEETVEVESEVEVEAADSEPDTETREAETSDDTDKGGTEDVGQPTEEQSDGEDEVTDSSSDSNASGETTDTTPVADTTDTSSDANADTTGESQDTSASETNDTPAAENTDDNEAKVGPGFENVEPTQEETPADETKPETPVDETKPAEETPAVETETKAEDDTAPEAEAKAEETTDATPAAENKTEENTAETKTETASDETAKETVVEQTVETKAEETKATETVAEETKTEEQKAAEEKAAAEQAEAAKVAEEQTATQQAKAASFVSFSLNSISASNVMDMDGPETLTHIRKDSNVSINKETPVILLTANTSPGMVSEAINMGFNGYISKPIVPAQLEDAIRDYLPKNKIKDVAKPQEKNKEQHEQHETLAANGSGVELSGSAKQLNVSPQEKASVEEAVLLDRAASMAGLASAQGVSILGKLYVQTLRDFAEMGEHNASEIENAMINKDYDTYTIKVHSLKSSASIIGATKVAEDAKELEELGDMARDGEHDAMARIEAGTENLLKEYRKLLKNLSFVLSGSAGSEADDDAEYEEYDESTAAAGEGPEAVRPAITPEELDEAYKTMREMTESLDLDGILHVLSSLRDYDLPEDAVIKLKQIKEMARDINFQGIRELLKE